MTMIFPLAKLSLPQTYTTDFGGVCEHGMHDWTDTEWSQQVKIHVRTDTSQQVEPLLGSGDPVGGERCSPSPLVVIYAYFPYGGLWLYLSLGASLCHNHRLRSPLQNLRGQTIICPPMGIGPELVLAGKNKLGAVHHRTPAPRLFAWLPVDVLLPDCGQSCL